MRKIFVFLLIFISLSVFAGNSAVILNEQVNYKISIDKLVTKHVYQKVQLNTPASFRYWGEWFYTFNPKLQKVNIIKSTTTRKDGVSVNTPENGILIQSPYETEDAPDFSNIREFMVSHIGLEPGCIVEFEYEIVDLIPHQTYIYEEMGGIFPVNNKVVTFDGDFSGEFFSKPVKRNGNSFSVNNFPVYELSHYYHSNDQIPYVSVNLENTISKFQKMFEVTDNDNLSATAKILNLSDKSSTLQIVEKIKSFVNDKLVDVHLSEIKTGYERRKIEEIVLSGFATGFEKACLSSLLLNYFKINNSVEAIVNKNSANLILNPQFVVNVKGYGLIYPEKINVFNKTEIAVTGDKIDLLLQKALSVSIELEEGVNSNFSGKLYAEGLNIDNTLQGLNCNFLKGATVKNEKNNNISQNRELLTSIVSFAPDKDMIKLTQTPIEIVHLDNLFDSLLYTTSLNLSEEFNLNLYLSIVFNSPMSAIFAKPTKISNEFGKNSVIWKMDGDKLVFEGSLTLNKGKIDNKEYEKLRDLLSPFISENTHIVFLKRK